MASVKMSLEQLPMHFFVALRRNSKLLVDTFGCFKQDKEVFQSFAHAQVSVTNEIFQVCFVNSNQ